MPALPAGYLWDAGSGMHYSEDTGLHYHQASQAFWSQTDQKWYRYEAATQRFTEIPAA